MIFNSNDWMWIRFQNERFPLVWKGKLSPSGDELFKVLNQINDNGYMLNLPSEFIVVIYFLVLQVNLCIQRQILFKGRTTTKEAHMILT